MLLSVHTDKEFTHWLQRHAEEGWRLNENKGNTFVFIKKTYDGKRVCSYTVNSDVLGFSAEDVFYDLQDDLRKKGWKLLVMGTPEKFTDRTRHAFLVETPREDLPQPEIPLSDPPGQMKLLRAALKKAVSTLALCLLYIAVLVYFIAVSPELLFSGMLRTVFLTLMAAVLLPCVFYSCKAARIYGKAVRDPEADSSMEDYLCLDKAVLLSSVMLVILAACLIIDFLV